jgi:hemerythrin-like domain-containing protein
MLHSLDASTMPHFALQVIRDEHAALAAVLRSLIMMIGRGPQDEPERFFDVVRAMLFYIDEFPERLHHPKESELLFPKIARVAPQLQPVIRQLDSDHHDGEDKVRHLQHLLIAWELLGDTRRPAFSDALEKYVRFYLDHMRTEEMQLLPAADELLTAHDWEELDAAFKLSRDPLAGGERDPVYNRLFTRIVMTAPSPIGVGP